MRVEGPSGSFQDPQGKDRVDRKKRQAGAAPAPGEAPPTFVEELQSAVLDEGGEEKGFGELIAEVDQAGRELIAHRDETHLKAYRSAVKQFLLAAVRRAYRLKVVEGRGPHPKLYVHIERIESRLADLAREVLATQKTQLKILAQIEEIRGLLFDLRM